MIYLDNAATSYPKPEKVYAEMDRCLREYCANPGRGGHSMSIASGRAVLEARERISTFFNISDPLQLCFTKNATESLNIAIKGILKKGDHVITSCMEHNSVMRPLKTLERDLSIEVSITGGDEFGQIDPQDVKKLIKENTRLIVFTLSSNVNGVIMPVGEIGKIARENGIIFLLDASQGAGSICIDVEAMNIDLMAFPGHKGLLGPQGTGGLYVSKNIHLDTLLEGGTGSHSEHLYQPEMMPDMLESGTLNTPGIVGLGHGIEFIESYGIEKLEKYKFSLVKRLHEGIEELGGVRLYSLCKMENNSGIVAMNFENTDSTEISYVLDRAYGIATRAGLHCSPSAHGILGTMQTGVVRFSVSPFNTQAEIDMTLEALKEISSNL